MHRTMLTAFFDELEKIGIAGPGLKGLGDTEQSTGALGNTPTKPGEVKQPLTPTQMKPKMINPLSGQGTNYTRSNVEAPGPDITLTQRQKAATPPPITF